MSDIINPDRTPTFQQAHKVTSTAATTVEGTSVTQFHSETITAMDIKTALNTIPNAWVITGIQMKAFNHPEKGDVIEVSISYRDESITTPPTSAIRGELMMDACRPVERGR